MYNESKRLIAGLLKLLTLRKKLRELVETKYNIEELHIMTKNNRDTIICEIRKESKASIKQSARVLEIGRGSVERAAKNMSNETTR